MEEVKEEEEDGDDEEEEEEEINDAVSFVSLPLPSLKISSRSVACKSFPLKRRRKKDED